MVNPALKHEADMIALDLSDNRNIWDIHIWDPATKSMQPACGKNRLEFMERDARKLARSGAGSYGLMAPPTASYIRALQDDAYTITSDYSLVEASVNDRAQCYKSCLRTTWTYYWRDGKSGFDTDGLTAYMEISQT